MNDNSSPSPRTAPGSHNPDFSASAPSSSWLQRNKGQIAILTVGVLAIFAVTDYLPKMRAEERADSWASYTQLLTDTPDAYGSANLASTLAATKDDPRVHPWSVLRGLQGALASQDKAALEVLIAEADSLRETGALAGLTAPNGESRLPVFELAVLRGKEALALSDSAKFELPTPTGATVNATLTLNEETAFQVTIGLYQEQAPLACAEFLSQIERGALGERDGTRSGSFAMTFKDTSKDAPEEGLQTEVVYGLSHVQGALSYAQKSGSGHLADPNQLEIVLRDAFHLDGRTPVFGKIIGGLTEADWEGLQYGGPGTEDSVHTLKLSAISVAK